MNRLVTIFLETAELRAKSLKDITIKFWQENVDRILQSNDMNILENAGKISNAQMEKKVNEIYQDFDAKRKAFNARLADEEDLKELQVLEKEIKGNR